MKILDLMLLLIPIKLVDSSLPFIQGCVVRSIKSILCEEANNLTVLPDISVDIFGVQAIDLIVKNRNIPVLPDFMFQGLKLTGLTLSDNLIETIKPNAFIGIVPPITKIILNNNRIRTIDLVFNNKNCSAFSGTTLLNLRGNLLTYIRTGSLECLTNLKNLYFTGNIITSIDESVFITVTKLAYIEMNSNQLTSVNFLINCYGPSTRAEFTSNKISIDNRTSPFKNFAFASALDLTGNSLSGIYNNTFDGLSRLNELYLGRNEIDYIDQEAFTHMRSLRRLDLGTNKIKKIGSTIFIKNVYLSTIFLDSNKIESIQIDNFIHTIYLSEIFLKSNLIVDIQDNSFSKLNFLNYLQLSFNKLTNLTARTFFGLTSLNSLDLDNNQIEFLEPDSLVFLTSLNYLNMSKNKMRSIEVTFPKDIAFIDLSYNQITFINKENLKASSLNKLIKIALQNNQIKAIHYDLFASFIFIKTFDLNNNSINILENSAFPKHYLLNTISINFNELEILKSNSFVNLKVDIIDIEYNKLYLIEKDAFLNSSIKDISLNHNRISMIQQGAFGLTSLSSLGLAHNKLTCIKSYLLSPLVKVATLIFSNNLIETIEKNAFDGITIRTLILRNNPLKYIHPEISSDLRQFTFVEFSMGDLISLGSEILIDSFEPRTIVKQNINAFYKAIFFQVHDAIYDKKFCKITFDLLKHNILLNLLDLTHVENALNQCSKLSQYIKNSRNEF